jgi:hypothetical protein
MLSFLNEVPFNKQLYCSNIYLENMSHSSLLLQRTMIVNGQNHWIRRCYKCASVDSFYHRSKWDLGGEGVAMVDDRRSIISIPTVQLNTTAASKKHLMRNIMCNPLSYVNACNYYFVPESYFLSTPPPLRALEPSLGLAVLPRYF